MQLIMTHNYIYSYTVTFGAHINNSGGLGGSQVMKHKIFALKAEQCAYGGGEVKEWVKLREYFTWNISDSLSTKVMVSF